VRVMGTEVEYGVSVAGNPSANAMLLSAQVVNAYASLLPSGRRRRAGWDFEEESPLRDARGFDLSGPNHVAEQFLEDEEDAGLANVVLINGARLYVDHAHPEYSTPEVTTPRDIVAFDKAGELVMAAAARQAARFGGPPISLYKNNTDNKGVSYGAHENYLMRRQTPFSSIVSQLIPFFVTRQVICGAGRVGIGQDGQTQGFQLSQRADFFEVEVGLETTLKRPIINTRDEPHADAEKYRRLHVIIGDANLAELSTLLKVGTTSLVLSMIEDGLLGDDLRLVDPVRELRQVSHDPTLRHRVRLADGRSMTALEVQAEYLDRARKYVDDRYGADADDATTEILREWESVVSRLDEDPMLLAGELDWVAKLRLLEGFRDRDGLDWAAPRLHAVDLQYADIRPDKGLYHKLVGRGSMRTLIDPQRAVWAVDHPPTDTRAFFRGECLRRYPDAVAAASWDSVIFDVGQQSLVRVPTMEPLRGTEAHVLALFERCPTARELVDVLLGRS
jgi:proteasome accessory factor PafA2